MREADEREDLPSAAHFRRTTCRPCSRGDLPPHPCRVFRLKTGGSAFSGVTSLCDGDCPVSLQGGRSSLLTKAYCVSRHCVAARGWTEVCEAHLCPTQSQRQSVGIVNSAAIVRTCRGIKCVRLGGRQK